MELQQLRYFKVIGEYENLTLASKRLLVSQPSLSNLIARLEQELGVSLFERVGRNIRLTDEGKILYRYSISITAEVDSLLSEIRNYSYAEDQRIKFASPNSIYLNSWLSEFLIANADKQVNHVLLKEEKMKAKLYSGDIDFALTTKKFEGSSKDFEYAFLMQDRYVLLVPENHIFANRSSIHLIEAKNEKFMALSTSPNYSRLVDQISYKAGFEPTVIFEGETALLEKLCAAGSGIFIHLQSSIAEMNLAGIKEVSLSDSFSRTNLFLVWKKKSRMSPACLEFKRFIIEWYNSCHEKRSAF